MGDGPRLGREQGEEPLCVACAGQVVEHDVRRRPAVDQVPQPAELVIGVDMPRVRGAVQPVVGLLGPHRLGLHGVDHVNQVQLSRELRQQLRGPLTTGLPQQPPGRPFHLRHEGTQTFDVVDRRAKARRAVEQHGGGPQEAGALQGPLPTRKDRESRPERSDLTTCGLRQRPISGAGRWGCWIGA